MKKFTLFLLISFSCQSKSQMLIESRKAELIKNGVTYVLMKDPNDPKASEFKRAIKDGWTFTKSVEFISFKDMLKYSDPANTFIKLSAYNTLKNNSNGTFGRMYTAVEVFQCANRFFKKGLPLKPADIDAIATLFFHGDSHLLSTDSENLLNGLNFLFKDHISNLYPGFLKNQLQQAALFLEENESVNSRNEIKNKEQLAVLKTATLYIPEFNRTTINLITHKKSLKDFKDVFNEYAHKYQIIDDKALSDKVLNGEPVYYVALTMGNGGYGIFTIINAKTGEFIYSKNKALSVNITANDMKDLNKIIK